MQAKDIKRITMIGAGTMGLGIGQVFAQAGFQVTYYDVSRDTLQGARQKLRRNLDQLVGWSLMCADEVELTLNRIHTTSSLRDAAGNADLIVEAVFEDLDLKRGVFRDVSEICSPHTILTSNTSSIMPSALAAATHCPDRVLVFHFCYPPHLLPLVEIVPGSLTSDKTIGIVVSIAKFIGKCPVVLQKESVGFIINRLQAALLREALYIVEQGIATAQDVDVAVKKSFGRRLAAAGPIEMAEVMDDWNQTLQFNKYILPDLDVSREPSKLMREKVDRGEWGAETGRGFYEWTPEYVKAWTTRLWTLLAESMREDGTN